MIFRMCPARGTISRLFSHVRAWPRLILGHKVAVLKVYTACMLRCQCFPQLGRDRASGSFATGLVVASSLWKPLSVQISRTPAPHTSVSRHLERETSLVSETISCERFPQPLPLLSAVLCAASQSELLQSVFPQAHPAERPSTCKPPYASAA